MTLQEAIRQLPKTDLHCHLDGSIRPETVMDIARREGTDLGVANMDELRRILVVGRKVPDLETFLKAFKLTTAVLQTKDGIERVAFELAEDAAKENVRYLEVRFTPLWCVQRGLTHEEIVRAARKGLARAEKEYRIRTGIVICAIRIFEPKVSMDLAKLAVSLKGEGVVGFDLAHAEAGHPAKIHAEAFSYAKKNGLGITVHAGESYGPESIGQAIEDCGADRIGHGRTLYQDPKLEKEVLKKGICLEACPSSNVQINLVGSFAEHPFKGYVERGLNVTLNTDNRLLTGINVTDEYLRSASELGLTWKQLTFVALNGFRSAFLPETERKRLVCDAEVEIRNLRPEI